MDGVTLPVTNDTDCGISVLPGVHSPLLMVLSLHNGYTFHNPSFLLVQFCKQLLRVCTGLQWDLVAFVTLVGSSFSATSTVVMVGLSVADTDLKISDTSVHLVLG